MLIIKALTCITLGIYAVIHSYSGITFWRATWQYLLCPYSMIHYYSNSILIFYSIKNKKYTWNFIYCIFNKIRLLKIFMSTEEKWINYRTSICWLIMQPLKCFQRLMIIVGTCSWCNIKWKCTLEISKSEKWCAEFHKLTLIQNSLSPRMF